MEKIRTIGILGGGQLALMVAREAKTLGFVVNIYCDSVSSCCMQDADVTIGQYKNFNQLQKFEQKCDVVTVETENIPVETIKFLEGNCKEKIMISSDFLEIVQHRLREKRFAQSLGIEVAKFEEISSAEDLQNAFNVHGAGILKTTMEGYDGKGQKIIKSIKDTNGIKVEKNKYIYEKFVDFICEISVIAVKKGDNVTCYPIPKNVHSGGILRESYLPFMHEECSDEKIEKVTEKALNYVKVISQNIKYTGVFAVEFFVTKNCDVIFNEMAPRVHNSGHYSQKLTNVSQFQNHVRAISNLPIIKPKLLYSGKMINLIGRDVENVDIMLDKDNYHVYLYGKSLVKDRKMGHVNVVDYV